MQLLRGVTTAPALSADAHDYLPQGIGVAVGLRLNPTAARSVTGLGEGKDGRFFLLENTSTLYALTLKHENAGSLAQNRFHTPNGADVTVQPNQAVLVIYDALSFRWRVVGQGQASLADLPQGAAGQLLVGQTSLPPAYKTPAGDVTIDADGVTAIGAQKVLASMLVRGTNGQLLIGQTGADPAYTSVTGDVTVDADGVTAIGGAKVTAAMLGANLRTGFIPLPLAGWRLEAANDVPNLAGVGGVLASDSAPALIRVNGATDKQLRVVWAAGSAVPIFHSFPYPPDLDDTAPIVINLLMGMAGAADTPVVTVGFWEGVGDVDAGGDTTALASAVAQKSVTIAAADVGAFPKAATVIVTPGAHATDAAWLYAAWAEYTRKT